jgi:hypothetical protein
MNRIRCPLQRPRARSSTTPGSPASSPVRENWGSSDSGCVTGGCGRAWNRQSVESADKLLAAWDGADEVPWQGHPLPGMQILLWIILNSRTIR